MFKTFRFSHFRQFRHIGNVIGQGLICIGYSGMLTGCPIPVC